MHVNMEILEFQASQNWANTQIMHLGINHSCMYTVN